MTGPAQRAPGGWQPRSTTAKPRTPFGQNLRLHRSAWIADSAYLARHTCRFPNKTARHSVCEGRGLPGGNAMADLRFMTLATDPTLIPGVYNGCDQWCDYCPLTERCLAFKCRRRPGGRGDIYNDIAEAMHASMIFLKDCHETEGLKPPADLMRLLHADPRERVAFVPVNDSLEKMGKHYALTAPAYLATSDEDGENNPKRPEGPPPFDIFFYYHVFIAL